MLATSQKRLTEGREVKRQVYCLYSVVPFVNLNDIIATADMEELKNDQFKGIASNQ